MFNNFIKKVYANNKDSKKVHELSENDNHKSCNNNANNNEQKFFQIGAGMVNLASNESMLGVSPKVIEVMRQSVQRVSSYPDAMASKCKRKIAEFYNINPEMILCGNGSEEIISNLCRAFVGPGDEVISSSMSFPLYEVATTLQGGTFIEIENPENIQKFSVDQVLRCITPRTKIIFLDNPSNPGGGYLNRDELSYLVKKVPSNVILVIDSAYAEYIEPFESDYDNGLGFVTPDNQNIVCLRTFSKAYGLAGLRAGWGYANDRIKREVERFKLPFNVNTLALKLAQVALSDQDFLLENVRKTKEIKDKVIAEISKCNFKALNTFTNFFLIKASDRNQRDLIHQVLSDNGLFTRKLPKLDNYLRITIGKEKYMSKMSEILQREFS